MRQIKFARVTLAIFLILPPCLRSKPKLRPAWQANSSPRNYLPGWCRSATNHVVTAALSRPVEQSSTFFSSNQNSRSVAPQDCRSRLHPTIHSSLVFSNY